MFELFINGFIGIRLLDIIDILLVAVLLFELHNLLKGTVAINIFIGIIAIFLIWQIVHALQMELLSKILGAFVSVGFIALIVIFQPEIRRFLFTLGTPSFIHKKNMRFLFWKFNIHSRVILVIDTILIACQRLADNNTGALIVITKKNKLKHYSETGITLDASISTHVIENIFYKNSPLHDGAIIITDNKIKAAGCILPLSNKPKLPSRLGLRHRAGIGITELSDAIAIIVSEQTGKIAYAKGGKLYQKVQPAQLKDFLENEFGQHEKAEKIKQPVMENA